MYLYVTYLIERTNDDSSTALVYVRAVEEFDSQGDALLWAGNLHQKTTAVRVVVSLEPLFNFEIQPHLSTAEIYVIRAQTVHGNYTSWSSLVDYMTVLLC
jgi:hypothetical protein